MSTSPTHVALKLLLDSAEDGTMGLRPGHPNIAVLITNSVLSIKTFVQQILVFKYSSGCKLLALMSL